MIAASYFRGSLSEIVNVSSSDAAVGFVIWNCSGIYLVDNPTPEYLDTWATGYLDTDFNYFDCDMRLLIGC